MLKNKVNSEDWTVDEVQWLVIQVGSLSKAAKRLGYNSTKEFRDKNIQSPPEYVSTRAKQDPNWLKDMIIRLGSKEKAAERLNVSTSHLTKVLLEIGCNLRPEQPSRDLVFSTMEKFGSVGFSARVLEITVNDIKRILGPEWRSLKDGTKTGKTSVRTGQIAERYVMEKRKDNLLSTEAADNHNNVGFDYKDTEYGKVNVKGSPMKGKGYYSWEFHPMDDMDTLALVFMTKTRVPQGYFMIPKSQALKGELPVGLSRGMRTEGRVALQCSKKFLDNLIENSQVTNKAS